jgi:hypothetical protein
VDPTGWKWVVVLHEETRRPINVFVLASSTRAVTYNGRTGQWAANPSLVNRVSWDDETQGLDRLRTTDRAGAEEAARQFGQTLPTDEELHRLLGPAPA